MAKKLYAVGLMMLVSFAPALNSCAKKEEKSSESTPIDPGPIDPIDVPPVGPVQTGKPQFPIVYVHGLMDGKRDLVKTYFAEIETASGVKVHRTEISPANSTQFRAGQLAKEVDRIMAETGAAKVNIVAHSMGGLDARYLISSLGYSSKVASLTTISTPHFGTPLTTLKTTLGADKFDKLINIAFGVSGKALNSGSTVADVNFDAAMESLSEEYVKNTFNPQNLDQPGVFYQSYSGASGPGAGHKTKIVLFPGNAYLKLVRGSNDGLVPEASAKWGTYLGSLKGDHLDISGRDVKLLGGDGFNYVEFFKNLLSGLAQRNL